MESLYLAAQNCYNQLVLYYYSRYCRLWHLENFFIAYIVAVSTTADNFQKYLLYAGEYEAKTVLMKLFPRRKGLMFKEDGKGKIVKKVSKCFYRSLLYVSLSNEVLDVNSHFWHIVISLLQRHILMVTFSLNIKLSIWYEIECCIGTVEILVKWSKRSE